MDFRSLFLRADYKDRGSRIFGHDVTNLWRRTCTPAILIAACAYFTFALERPSKWDKIRWTGQGNAIKQEIENYLNLLLYKKKRPKDVKIYSPS